MSGNDIAEANRQGGAQALRKAAARVGLDDRPFAILRYAKLNSSQAISGSSKHMRRAIPTPNADSARTAGNVLLYGTEDPAADVEQLLPPMPTRDPETGKLERDASGRLRRRANSVLAVEVLITTSPEWWRDASQEDQDAWVAKSSAWLAAEWGEENIAHLELHTDETTPHLTGFLVPLDEGCLNARRWIGGKSSKMDPGTSLLSGHQTRYAAAVEDLGLRRGRIGSTAKHESVASYYRRVNEATGPMAMPKIPVPPMTGKKAWAENLQRQVSDQVRTMAAQAQELAVERRRAQTLGGDLDRSAAALERVRAERQALAAQMRELPLEDVLEALGAEFDAKDKRWKIGPPGSRDHRIQVTGRKWRCAVLQTGGGGAIDLVKAVQGGEFNDALAWLSSRYGSEATAAAIVGNVAAHATRSVEKAEKEGRPFVPPEADAEAWPEVRTWLIEERGLPAEIVDEAHGLGNVYAQTRPGPHGGQLVNAIFLARDEDGRPTGAEIKGLHKLRDGSRWSGMAAGSRKPAGSFRAGVQRVAEAARVIVVESAIDALSALAWVRSKLPGGDGDTTVVSTAGDGAPAAPTLAAIPAGARRLAGQDANAQGDKQAQRLGAEWERLRPPEPFEDWNDWAQAAVRKGNATDTDPDLGEDNTPSIWG